MDKLLKEDGYHLRYENEWYGLIRNVLMDYNEVA